MRLALSLRNRVLVTLAAFGAIGLSILPADFEAVQSARLVEPVKAAPAFNAPPIPQEALAKAPVVSSPEPLPAAAPAQASLNWRSVQTGLVQPAQVQQAALVTTSAEPPNLRTDTVNSAVNVHIDGRKGSPVTFVLAAGTAVRVAESNGGWVHVYSDRGEGWVYSTFVGAVTRSPDSPDRKSSPDVTGRTARIASAVMVSDEPNGDPIYLLGAGERVRIIEVEGKWARIVTSSGEGGWIRLR
jgi:SH3-like domain-containing protein